MKIAVTGASGLVGTPLLRRLRTDGHEVVQLVRRDPRQPGEARWDPAAGTIEPGALDGVEAAVNLSGAGVGDKRWTDEYKRTILTSRVDSTRTLAAALAALDPVPSVLLNASAVGYYGDRGEEVLTEESAPGDGFLADVCVDWEAATLAAQEAGIRTAHLRTGLVLSAKGGAFGRQLPLFRLGLGGPLGRGRMWWPWITLEDQLAAIRFLLDSDLSGPVNLTGPGPTRQAEVARALGDALHRPALVPVPPPALHVVLGEFAGDVLASQRAVSSRLLDAGFTFRHPDIASACAWVVRR